MGCRSSKQHNGDIFNEENIFNKIRRKLLTGIQMSKDTNGIEGNFQIAFGKTENKVRKSDKRAPCRGTTRTGRGGIKLWKIFRKVFTFRKSFFLKKCFSHRRRTRFNSRHLCSNSRRLRSNLRFLHSLSQSLRFNS